MVQVYQIFLNVNYNLMFPVQDNYYPSVHEWVIDLIVENLYFLDSVEVEESSVTALLWVNFCPI
jgi:hypothetical protein